MIEGERTVNRLEKKFQRLALFCFLNNDSDRQPTQNRLSYEEINRRIELPFLEVSRLSSSIAWALPIAPHKIRNVGEGKSVYDGTVVNHTACPSTRYVAWRSRVTRSARIVSGGVQMKAQ